VVDGTGREKYYEKYWSFDDVQIFLSALELSENA